MLRRCGRALLIFPYLYQLTPTESPVDKAEDAADFPSTVLFGYEAQLHSGGRR